MRYAPSPRQPGEARLEGVIRSFQGMAGRMHCYRVPGVQLRLTCDIVEDDDGAQVRVQTVSGEAAAVLLIRRGSVSLRAASQARPGADLVTVIEDELSVRLDDELRWGDAVFGSADGLAARLLEHAARRLSIIAPRDTAPAGRAGGYGWARAVPSMRTVTPLRPPRMRDG